MLLAGVAVEDEVVFVTVTLPLVPRVRRTAPLAEPMAVVGVLTVAAAVVPVVVPAVDAPATVLRPVPNDAAVTLGMPELATVGSVPVAANVPTGIVAADVAVVVVSPAIVAAAVVPVVAVVRAPLASKTPSPAPLLMAGIGSELIDELIVTCGFARNAGFWNAPVWKFAETYCWFDIPGLTTPR